MNHTSPPLSPAELHHGGGAAQGAASRAGGVLHHPHDQVRRTGLSLRRPGLHLLLQCPLRRERLISAAASLHVLLLLLTPSSQLLLFLLSGESDFKPFHCPFKTRYSFFFFPPPPSQILTLFPSS